MQLKRFRNEETGAALVMVALSLVVLFGITAIVVDLGAQYNERRQSVTAADGAALAAAQNLGNGTAAAVTAALDVARKDLRAQYTDDEWTTLWTAVGNGCGSPSSVVGNASGWYYKTGTTTCVTFNNAGTRVRVRIPDQIMATTFGKALGVNDMRTHAAAEAGIDVPGTGGVLPFGILATGGGGQEVCLKDGSGGASVTPCDGPDTGNFGYIASPLYGGNPTSALGTFTECGTGHGKDLFITNLILGIDHLLDEYQETAAEASEAERPDSCFTQRPNRLYNDTGNHASDVDEGLVRGSTSTSYATPTRPARLQQGPYATRTVSGEVLDDKPLWDFLGDNLVGAGTPSPGTVPNSCLPSAFTGTGASKTQLNLCFKDYSDGGWTTPLFTKDSDTGDSSGGAAVYDIQYSPRFAFVPEFHENVWPSGSSAGDPLTIKTFRAAFIQTVFFKCNAGSCNITFNPGESAGVPVGGGSDHDEAVSLTAMLFKNTMLPYPIMNNGPGGSLGSARVALIN